MVRETEMNHKPPPLNNLDNKIAQFHKKGRTFFWFFKEISMLS